MAYPGIVQKNHVYRIDTGEKMSHAVGGNVETNLPDNTLVEITTSRWGYIMEYMRPCDATLDSLRDEDGYFEGELTFLVNDNGKANRRGNIAFDFLKPFDQELMFAYRGEEWPIVNLSEMMIEKAFTVYFAEGTLRNDQDFEEGSKVRFKNIFYTNGLEASDIELMP